MAERIKQTIAFFKFLWDSKGDQIKPTQTLADYQDGGQKMLDII